MGCRSGDEMNIRTVIVPAAHAETDIEDGPLPKFGCEVVLLVRIRDKRIVGCHHGNVQVDKITEKGRLVSTGITRGEFLVPVALNVPMGIRVSWVVVLGASHFDLLETPLWQVHVACPEIATKIAVFESEGCRQGSKFGPVSRCRIGNDLNNPVIFGVTNCGVAVTGNFPIGLGDGRSDAMGMKVAAGLCMDHAKYIAITNISERRFRVKFWLTTVWIKEPVIVGVLVVIAGDLLLL